ncbi:hypothetical protein HZS_1598, partial [Henneguya salminicola]
MNWLILFESLSLNIDKIMQKEYALALSTNHLSQILKAYKDSVNGVAQHVIDFTPKKLSHLVMLLKKVKILIVYECNNFELCHDEMLSVVFSGVSEFE